MDELFFELIRVAIGNQQTLSRQPSKKEWRMLYAMAEKQSLIGICFAGIRRLGGDADEGFANIGMPEMLYLTWMGTAASIQMRNEQINKQCVNLGERLKAGGYRYCILKGQSAAALYKVDENEDENENPSDLSLLRQPGDIDVWVDAPRKVIMQMIQKIAPTTNVREHHLELKMFDDTEVEVHFWPAVIRHFLKNRRLQKWFDTKREEVFPLGKPTPEFHAVQMMAHMYHHLFDSGVGLRQAMDYYFVLKALRNENEDENEHLDEVSKAIEKIGMGRFASAMIWVLATVFDGRSQVKDWMLCEPNEEDGRFLLGEIMRGGNFGKHDTMKVRDTSNYFSSFYGGIFRNMRYLRFNRFDWFWSPLWRLYYFAWRKVNGYH